MKIDERTRADWWLQFFRDALPTSRDLYVMWTEGDAGQWLRILDAYVNLAAAIAARATEKAVDRYEDVDPIHR